MISWMSVCLVAAFCTIFRVAFVKDFQPTHASWILLILSGKKSKSVFDFLTYSRETGFSFSYGEVVNLFRANEPSNEIDRVSNLDNFLSFGAKQKSLGQIFFLLWFFKDFFAKNSNWIFFYFLWFQERSIKECIYVCLSMQIQENMFMSIAAHLWGCFWVF